MCYETVPKLQIWLTKMFPKSMYVRLMEIYDKSATMVTSSVFNTRQQVASTSLFWNWNFRAF